MFGWLKRRPVALDVRAALIDAVARRDGARFARLCNDHREEITREFAAWKKVPDDVRSDPARTQAYVAAMFAVARAFEQMGDRSLLDELQGPDADNPLLQWRKELARADDLIRAGTPEEAITALRALLTDVQMTTGPGADVTAAAIHGRIGMAYLRTRNKGRAEEATRTALELCERIGDEEGIRVYRQQLTAIQGSNEDGAYLLVRDESGRPSTLKDLSDGSGRFEWEVVGPNAVPPDAARLHADGRAAGARGDYASAIAAFEAASKAAPDWPYPLYDLAYTSLLLDDTTKAEELYARVVRMAPRGFFTAKTTLDCLRRERAGALPPGFCKAFVSLESVEDTARKRALLRHIVEQFPTFSPAWKELAAVAEDEAERSRAIDQGLQHDPDPETRGMLLLSRAAAMGAGGERNDAVALLRELVADPASTSATEALAKALLARFEAT